PRHLYRTDRPVTWTNIASEFGIRFGKLPYESRPLMQHNYFSLYLPEYDAVCLGDIPGALTRFGLASQDGFYSYNSIRAALEPSDSFRLILGLSAPSLMELRQGEAYFKFIEAFREITRVAKHVFDIERSFARTAAIARVVTKETWGLRKIASDE